MIYYRRYVADFRADTMALSMMEQGAYDRLLDHYYATEQPIPLALDRAAIICRAVTAKERSAVKDVLEQYFERRADGWHQKRADHEIAMSEKARSNGARNAGRQPGPERGPDVGPDLPADGEPSAGPDAIPATGPTTGPDRDSLSAFQPRTILSTSQPSNLSANPVTPAAAQPSSRKPRASANPATAAVWSAYSAAYLDRYHTEPVRNAKVNTHITRFVDRVGAEEAPQIAAFYLTHSARSYVASKHDSKFLDMDAEGLRTEWATGQRVTQAQATQADRTQANGSVFQKLIEEAEAREHAA